MYILITPVKNEENNLSQTINSLLHQDVKPKLWVIVDDNSDDGTPEIIQRYSDKISWIAGIKSERKNTEYDASMGYSKVVRVGINYAKKTADTQKIEYNYIGILDGDITLNKDYFKILMQEADEIEKCGIISGLLHEKTKKDPENGIPRGGARLYNKKCLEEIGVFPITTSPDTVTGIKAVNREWKLVKTGNASGLQLRPQAGKKGLLHGYKKTGEGDYYLGYHPVNIFLAGIYLCFKFPFYTGLALLYGYFSSFILRKKQTDDKEIKEYFGEQKFRNLKNKLRKKLNLKRSREEDYIKFNRLK